MKVVLGTLKNKGEELATFLEPRVGAKPSVSGGEIEIEDESIREGVHPRHVKTYIKRFLYMNGVRKNYRVFVAGKELTIQEIVLGEKKEEEKAPVEKPEPEPVEVEAEKEEEPKHQKAKKAPAKKAKAKKKKAETED
ncbi:MAG: hypothetical protein OK404_02155 [Thaumarchaeota archaeon]|nr:hypothetical protein [Nitrososphaerota archaeon]